MHRSGTSMVAELLEALGFRTGDSEELLPAGEDNPRGFRERRDLVDLNDRVLERAGGSWFRPPLEPVVASADDEALFRVILDKLGDAPSFLKDPRLVITWPCWESLLGNAPIVYIYRSPAAVANSLRQRNGFPPDLGLALWEHYNRCILALLRGRSFIALSYEAFGRDPQGQCEALVEALVAMGFTSCQLPDSLSATYDRLLDHNEEADPAIDSLLTDEQRQLNEWCEALVSSGELPEDIIPPSPVQHYRLSTLAGGFGHAGILRQLEDLADHHRQERDDCLQILAKKESQHGREMQELMEHHLQREQEDQRKMQKLQQQLHKLKEQQQTLLAEWSQEREAILDRHLAEQADVELRHEAERRSERQKLFSTLLAFSASPLGRLFGCLSFCYRWLTLRPGRGNPYTDLLATAKDYLAQFPSPEYPARRSRLQLIGTALAYLVRNPAGSLRSLSWPRVKRALKIFSGSDRDDLARWVDQRFPREDGQLPSADNPAQQSWLDSLELSLPSVEDPRVSIVIPAYNEYRMTAFCLKTLLDSAPEVSYEVILADDASTDLTATIEQRVSGLRLSRSDGNLGFVRNCNAAAAMARGHYLVLLNNDTALCDHWLDHLVEVLDNDPEAGIVGPKLLFGNRRLQEAGGIIWDDASGWNYGRMEDPSRPEFNYRKRCDYVSGACLMVRRSLWEQLGGFDERYVPAYYEDTDLCFAARELGYRVIYQPRSEVIHFEGGTNGTDLGSGIKKYQLDNQRKFFDKWRAVLLRDHFPNGKCVFRARDRSRDRRTILVIDHYVPSFDKDAGSRSTWLYLQLMVAMGYNVKFMGANFFPHQPYTELLQQMGVEVLVGEWMARHLETWLDSHQGEIHTVYLHRPHIAEQFLDIVREQLPDSRIIYFGHDLHYLRLERELAVTGDKALEKEAADWRRREYAVFAKVDRIYYPSQVEVDEILEQSPQLPVRAIPLYVLKDLMVPSYSHAERADLMFVGGFNHTPNEDAVVWFVREVMPQVWQELPELKFHIVGSNITTAVQALAGPGVQVHGYLTDEALATLYGRIQHVVVPLRFGAGVKGKVLEAVQHGVPVTTTPVGSEGLPDAESVLNVAGDALAMARSVLAVAKAQQDCLEKLQHYPEWLQSHFSRSSARSILLEDFGEPGDVSF